MHSPISKLPWILQAQSKALHGATCGLQGIALIIFSGSYKMASTAKKVDHRCNVLSSQKSYILWSLKHNSTCLHPPNLHGYKLTEDKQKWYHLAAHLLHTSIQNFRELPYHAHAWHMLWVWQSKWPHFKMASCWTLSRHCPCSHILHTCLPSYLPQRPPAHNLFEWSDHELSCHLQVLLNQHMHSATAQK